MNGAGVSLKKLKKKLKKRIKKFLKPLADFLRKITYKLMKNVIKELEAEIRTSRSTSSQILIPYYKEELIRVMFLFQAASFWPSWETFYQACIKDPRIRVEFTFLNELYGDTTQMLTAQKFLEEKGIPYKVYSDSLFSKFSPHVLIMQTPYDYGHRKFHVRSAAFKKRGTRIVYIPYGIELSNTEHAQDAHFHNAVVRNSWRIFTFSERMREDYRQLCPNFHAVKCLGHPKFDGLYHKENFKPLEEVFQRAGERKVLVWHVHFPKITPQPDGSGVMVTPKLEIYLDFAKHIISQKNVFVVFLPHPKFLDGEGELGILAEQIMDVLKDKENVYIDWSDDYRNSLLNCDFFITDRSALMVEAATTGIPVLYMSNEEYSEPLTPAVEPMIDSYYQGISFQDMIEFLDQCMRGDDPKKELRSKAFRENVPYFDGGSGERIKEHIVWALANESMDSSLEKIDELRTEVKELEEEIKVLIQQKKT